MPSERTQSVIDELSRSNPFSGAADLPEPTRPDEQMIPRTLSSADQLPYIQKQLDILSYNHLPHTFFNLEKQRALQSILLTGKEALTEALPVRCLEATFIGLYLTQDLKDVDRIPLSFRSQVKGCHYQHIVLVVHVRNPSRYGALGLSRKSTLMYKPLKFRTLFDLVMDYKKEYEVLGHELVDIKLGLSVTHEHHWRHHPCWRFVALRLSQFEPTDNNNNPKEGSAADANADGAATTTTGGDAAVGEALPVQPNEPIHTDEGDGEEESASPRSSAHPLLHFLCKYCRLLPVMSEQYCKALPVVDNNNRNAKLCLVSLEEADRDAKDENQRRIAAILKLQSPLSQEARKAAAKRKRKPSTKKRRSRGASSKKKGKSSTATTPATASLPPPASPAAAAAALDTSASGDVCSAAMLPFVGVHIRATPTATRTAGTEGSPERSTDEDVGCKTQRASAEMQPLSPPPLLLAPRNAPSDGVLSPARCGSSHETDSSLSSDLFDDMGHDNGQLL